MRKSKSHTTQLLDAVKYGRVSSKEQEKEGFSIPAQFKLLDQYAQTQGLKIVRELSMPKRPSGQVGLFCYFSLAAQRPTYSNIISHSFTNLFSEQKGLLSLRESQLHAQI